MCILHLISIAVSAPGHLGHVNQEECSMSRFIPTISPDLLEEFECNNNSDQRFGNCETPEQRAGTIRVMC